MRNTVVICFILSITGHCACVESTTNNRPIIGVLAQELLLESDPEFNTHVSYIAASYVKFLEGAGARVVPIMINKTDDYYEHIANQVNGVLLPGGGTYFDTPGGYAEAGQKLFNLAMKMNQAGDYFPVLGICLGFELLTYLAANNVEHRARCYSYNEALPLQFKGSFTSSKLFGRAPFSIIGILVKENITANFHLYCLTEKVFTAASMKMAVFWVVAPCTLMMKAASTSETLVNFYQSTRLYNPEVSNFHWSIDSWNMTELHLDEEWLFMTTNKDSDGLEFISSLEHQTYPLYGLQFHPEKNIYEWKEGKVHPHSAEAIRVSQYFANFFVNEARKNAHKFPNESEEMRHLIYNYPVKYTIYHTVFEQCYVFEV